MKNTMSKHHDAVITFLKVNPNSTFDTIKEGCKSISDIMLRKAIKDLQAEGTITANDEDGGYVFNGAIKNGTVLKQVAKADAKVKEEKVKEEDDLGPATFSGRDYSKYDFDGQKGLTKGRLAHAIIKKYAESNPKTTLAKMEELFKNKEIQPRYGVFEEVSKAKKHTKNNRERYFLKPEEQIKVGNVKVAVTNQWSAETLKPLLAIAKTLGYKASVSKA